MPLLYLEYGIPASDADKFTSDSQATLSALSAFSTSVVLLFRKLVHIYQYIVLLFGLATAVMAFTKCMAVVMACLRTRG